MKIEKHYFGTTKGGEAVDCYKLIASDGSYVNVLTYGLIVQKLGRSLCRQNRRWSIHSGW